jgi:hypothetical protein
VNAACESLEEGTCRPPIGKHPFAKDKTKLRRARFKGHSSSIEDGARRIAFLNFARHGFSQMRRAILQGSLAEADESEESKNEFAKSN